MQSQDAAGHRPGRGPDVHGHAGREVAEGAAGGHGGLLLADRLQSRPASGRKRSSSSIRQGHSRRRGRRRGARPAVFPDGTAGAKLDPPGHGPARGLRRLADHAEKSLVRAATSSTASGPGCWAAASSTSRTTSGPTIRPQSRAAGLSGAGVGRGPLRPEAHLPADPELADVSAFLDPRSDDPPRRRRISPRYPLRRLEAEVLIDALCQITGTTEEYSSAIPEPFTFIPEASARSPWPTAASPARFWSCSAARRATPGLESERNNRPTAAQRLHLLNSSHIQQQDRAEPEAAGLAADQGRPRETVDGALSDDPFALPDEEEKRRRRNWQTYDQYGRSPVDMRGEATVIDSRRSD